jgi:hypothetical protein
LRRQGRLGREMTAGDKREVNRDSRRDTRRVSSLRYFFYKLQVNKKKLVQI